MHLTRNHLQRAVPQSRARRGQTDGFSLVEVLVALVICSVGLLGLAKMESIALAGTGVAGGRSLAAVQAASLASAMHANRAYWGQAGTPPATFTVTSAAISDPTLSVAATCDSTAAAPATPLCNAAQMAAYDVQKWQAALTPVLPAFRATVSCSTLATQPVNCNIQLQWQERAAQAQTQTLNTAAQNAAAAAAVAQIQYTNPYILYVQP